LIRTIFHNLVARYHRRFTLEEVTGGGIEQFGDHYLVATGSGRLFALRWDAGSKDLDSKELEHRVPVNRDEFVADSAHDIRIPTVFFRVADILVRDHGDTFELYASHQYWNREKKCNTVRISETSGRYDDFEAAKQPAAWQTLYESAPCLPLKSYGDPYAGFQIGGKMAFLDDRTILIAIGDHAFDGVEDKAMLPQDESAAYGKIMAVDIESGAAEVYSSGHRNPQGLTVAGDGSIWETEHGPRGGDELNLIVRGRNYGWPLVTLGTNYNQPLWPLNPKQGRHEGFEAPAFAWVPSIGVSSVISVRNGFQNWQGDLLVSALNDSSIRRTRVTDGKVMFAERIEIGERVRDILQDRDGRLVLWTEEQRVPPTYTAVVVIDEVKDARSIEGLSSAERGELVFTQCDGCHRVIDGWFHTIGPDLFGVNGRKIASAPKFGYSPALSGISATWTDENLDAFLENPQKFAPGTTMVFPGIADRATRAEIIQYLKTVPKQ
jgi:cytochrome c2